MWRNYLITSIRNVRRNLSFGLLNVLGLTLGISSCLLLFLVIRYETGFDSFHLKGDDIYRITGHRDGYGASTSLGVAPALRNDFPEIERVSQIWMMGPGIVKTGEKLFEEKAYLFADENFLQLFDYEWIEGNPKSALSEPGTIVLTEGLAKKYFGQRDAMGQVITVSNPNYHLKYDLKVAGIVMDPPPNTHLPFKFIVSYATLKKDLNPEMFKFYSILGASSYALIPDKRALSNIEKKLPGFLLKNWGEEVAKENQLLFQPLSEIHFDKRYGVGDSFSYTVSEEYCWAIGAIALFILLMACINFINLSTALSAKRSKEVGIRKTMGGSRRQLVMQFMAETSFIVALSMLLSVVVTASCFDYMERVLNIKLDYREFENKAVIMFVAGIGLLITLLAGIYPAYLQSGFKPVIALRNQGELKVGSLNLRNGLVTFQFVISQGLIIATLIVGFQMDFLRNHDLGFIKEAVVSFDLPDISKQKILQQRLASDPGILQNSFSSGAPSYNVFFTPFHSHQLGLTRDEVSEIRFVDDNYIDMFGLTLLAGEKIATTPEGPSNFNDTSTLRPVVVNESLVKMLALKDPQDAIGKRITIYWNYAAVIIGVVRDFQSGSKHKERTPCMLFYGPSRFISVSATLKGDKIHETLDRLEKNWAELFPDNLFKYEFLDDHIASVYKAEEREYTIFKAFSFIAVLIGCLGLYGLVAFTAVQRTKEIGIRKVLGARISDIVGLLSRHFIGLILLACLIAIPIAWYFMEKWLENFAYHISISWWIFLAGAIVSLLVAFITIGQQALKAALTNPVKSLRTE